MEGDLESAYATIEAALASVTGTIDALRLTDDEPKRIGYRGPLGRRRYLKLDIADDELVLNVNNINLLSRWPDLPEAGVIRAYTLAEIAGEKLRCVMQRMQCRDLLDLWLLFEDAGVDPSDAAEVFRPKAAAPTSGSRPVRSQLSRTAAAVSAPLDERTRDPRAGRGAALRAGRAHRLATAARCRAIVG